MAHHFPSTQRVVRRRSHRWATAGLATICLSAVLVMAPTPRLVSAQDMQVRTERRALVARAAPRSGDAVAPAQAADDHGPALRAALDARGRRTSGAVRAGYHAIGVGLSTAPDEPILVRGRVEGRWTPWVELSFAIGEGPDVGTQGSTDGLHSEPVWMGTADAYELDAPAEVSQIDVHLVADAAGTRSIAVTPASAGAAGAPSIALRSAWGARPEKEHPVTSGDLKLAVVHHSVNANTYSAADVPSLLRSIQAYHQDVQGWNDIGYNFAVDRFGQRWEGHAGGIAKVVTGGHSQGFNTGSVGVVVLGDFTTAAVPAAATESVAQIIAWKFALHRVSPSSTVPYTSFGSAKYPAGTSVTLPRVVGHRDVQLTGCPGNVLYSSLGSIRSRVSALLGSYQADLAPLLLPTDLDGDGRIDPLEYRPGTSGDLQWRAEANGQLTTSAATVNGTYRPAVGDFDGNGRSDILWYGTGSAADWIWWRGSSGYSSQPTAVNGSYVPLVGDFDGNGQDDIFWYATGLASDWVWYFQPNGTPLSRPATQGLSTAVPLVGDFNGDSRADIFFYGPGTASDSLWLSTGSGFTATTTSVSGWYDPAVLDATGDGVDDILWFSPSSTQSYRWDFTATSHRSISLTTHALSGSPTVGDFDGDGLDDVLLTASGSAADEVWYSTPTGIVASSVSVNGTYEQTAGRMRLDGSVATDDVLYVSGGANYLWEGLPSRKFSSSPVG